MNEVIGAGTDESRAGILCFVLVGTNQMGKTAYFVDDATGAVTAEPTT